MLLLQTKTVSHDVRRISEREQATITGSHRRRWWHRKKEFTDTKFLDRLDSSTLFSFFATKMNFA
jgi:hypothetical protein